MTLREFKNKLRVLVWDEARGSMDRFAERIGMSKWTIYEILRYNRNTRIGTVLKFLERLGKKLEIVDE